MHLGEAITQLPKECPPSDIREINSSLRAVWYILARQNGPRAKGPRAVLAGENIPHARKDEFIGILVTLARVAR